MKHLIYTSNITERRNFGKTIVNQTIAVEADFDPATEYINNIQVRIYENNKCLGEISKLLDKAEGNPLSQMIEAINWKEIYYA